MHSDTKEISKNCYYNKHFLSDHTWKSLAKKKKKEKTNNEIEANRI